MTFTGGWGWGLEKAWETIHEELDDFEIYNYRHELKFKERKRERKKNAILKKVKRFPKEVF